jgi:hypothetical protein
MSTKKKLTRSPERVRNQGEVFTPSDLAQKAVQRWMHISFRKPEDVFVDLQCGTGHLLQAVLKWKLENNVSREMALRTILGVDISQDNVDDCRRILLNTIGAGDEKIYYQIVQKNIIQGDSVQKDISNLFPNYE